MGLSHARPSVFVAVPSLIRGLSTPLSPTPTHTVSLSPACWPGCFAVMTGGFNFLAWLQALLPRVILMGTFGQCALVSLEPTSSSWLCIWTTKRWVISAVVD